MVLLETLAVAVVGGAMAGMAMTMGDREEALQWQ